MMTFLFIIFLLFVLPSEYYIYRKDVLRQKRLLRHLYNWVNYIVWGGTLICIISAKIICCPPEWLMKVTEASLVFFLFNGIAKIIFAISGIIGRKTNMLGTSHMFAVALCIFINLIMTYSATTGRWSIREERVDIVSEKISSSLAGLRIVAFSDIHAGHLLDKYDILGRMVDAINELDADIVVNLGDLVNNDHTELSERTRAILSGIKSKYGVYSVLGNHDMGKYLHRCDTSSREEEARKVALLQESMGWRVLRNETDMIPVRDDTIYISGVDFPGELMTAKSSHGKLNTEQGYADILETVPADKFNVTLSHAPQAWEELLEAGKSDLTISGHVHSFQIKIKTGRNKQWSPAKWFYDHWSGLYSENDDYIYVNDGIGYAILPMRIWCKPELSVIELREYEDHSVCGDNK